MADAKRRIEKIIELPVNILNKLNGFAIDFGGSVIKLAYLSIEDWKKDQKEDTLNQNGKLRLTSFAREQLDECFDFIKENCFIKRKSEDDKPLMYTCGIGGFQYGKKIENSLNVRTQNENEMDGFKYTMQYYLNNYPLDTFCIKPNTEVQKTVLEDQRKMRSRFKALLDEGMVDQNSKMKEGVEEIMERQYDPTAHTKPYILASFGSAWVCLRCGEDNKFSGCGFNVFAGRSFLGLGTLLTGAKTYDELMTLAERGNNLNLDITFKDITEEGKGNSGQKEKSDDVYGKAMKDMMPRPVFLWGKAVQNSLENFKKEDLAKTLLYTMCQELVRTAINAMHMTRTKHLFVAGSFISHPLTQRLVEEEFEYSRWGGAMYYDGIDGDYHLHILDFGSHFGAIGSFMYGPERAERMRKRTQEDQT